MKRFFFPFLVAVSLVGVLSCQKNSSLVSTPETGEIATPLMDGNNNVLLTATVINSMNSIGAIQIAQPSGWTPMFANYSDVLFYTAA